MPLKRNFFGKGGTQEDSGPKQKRQAIKTSIGINTLLIHHLKRENNDRWTILKTTKKLKKSTYLITRNKLLQNWKDWNKLDEKTVKNMNSTQILAIMNTDNKSPNIGRRQKATKKEVENHIEDDELQFCENLETLIDNKWTEKKFKQWKIKFELFKNKIKKLGVSRCI